MMRVNSTLADIQQPIQCLEIKFLKFFITYNLSFAIFLIQIVKRPLILIFIISQNVFIVHDIYLKRGH